MNKIKNEIFNTIKKNKKDLSDNTLKTYSQLLYTLFNNIYKNETFNIDLFNNENIILKYLKDINPITRKTILSALLSISKDNKLYKLKMYEDIQLSKEKINLNKKSEAQEKNWVDNNDIKKVYNKLLIKVKHILENIEDNINIKDYQIYQDLIILIMASGMFYPPRRSLDLTEFKIKNINKLEDNYLYNNKLIFNNYKTNKNYGEQIIKIDNKDFLKLLKEFIELNPYEYLLTNNSGNKLTEITLNQKIKKLFNGKCGINIFRHLYITNVYKDIPDLKKISEDMGHSLMTQQDYIKNK